MPRKIRYVSLDRARADVGVAPDFVEQFFARKDAARAAQERNEQIEFERREIEPAPVALDDVLVEIDREPFVLQLRPRLDMRTAQFRLDVGQQLGDFERLAQIVVGAVREALDLIFDLSARAEHHDRRVGDAPELGQHVESAHFRHHYVEHDEVGRPVPYEVETGGAVGGAADVVSAMAQRER